MPRYWSESDTSDTPPAVSSGPNTGLNTGLNIGNGLNTGTNTGSNTGLNTGPSTGNGLSCWYDQLRQNPGMLYSGPRLSPVTSVEARKEKCSVATKKEEEEEEKDVRSPLSGACTSEEDIRRLVQDWLARVRAGADTELEAEERSPVNPRLCVRWYI